MYYKTEAIILKKRGLGEVDSIITCYSRDFGKIEIVARGLRKSTSKLRGHTEPFSYSLITFVNGNRRILTDAETIDSFFGIKSDFKKITAGLFVLNLVDKAVVGEEKDEKIFKLIVDFLGNIQHSKDLKLAVAKFELGLLSCLGYAPDKNFFESENDSQKIFDSINNFSEKTLNEKLPKPIF